MNPIIESDIDEILKEDIDWKELDKKTFLITGASGMIGQYITFLLLRLNQLRKYNIKIVAVCHNREKAEKIFDSFLEDKNLILISQDIEDKLKYDGKVNYIVHAASPANPIKYSTDPVGTILANTLGTYNTLELARRNKAKYCYISTMEIYGKLNVNYDIKEEEYGAIDSLNIRSCYPESKKMGENLCVSYKEQYGVDTKIIRLAHTYGPGMSIDDPRVQCEFMKKVINDEDIILKSDGSTKRTYTYVSDAVAGIFYAILKGKEIVYNVANKNAIITIKQLAELIIKAKGKTESKLKIQIQEQKGWTNVPPKIMNCDRLENIGWKAKIDAESGLKRMLKSFLY